MTGKDDDKHGRKNKTEDELPRFSDTGYGIPEELQEPDQKSEDTSLDPQDLRKLGVSPQTPDEMDETRIAATDTAFLDKQGQTANVPPLNELPGDNDMPETAVVDHRSRCTTGLDATEGETMGDDMGDTREVPSLSKRAIDSKAETVDMNDTVPATRGPGITQHGGQTASGSRMSAEENTAMVSAVSKNKTKKLETLPEDVPEKHKPYLKLIGKSLDGYFIENLLGAGGMGAVYLAHQTSLDRKVAVKILPERLARNKKMLARFTREALSAAQMNHHNVMGVIDVGFDKGYHYISLEFVSGKSIGDLIRKEGRMTVDDTASYILQACRGLDYAHTRGMIHRDIKPDNLMVNEHGIVKIADMGLAKMTHWDEKPEGLKYQDNMMKVEAMAPDLTQAEIAMGTPAYMSPEQAQDTASVDFRSDQYSLGCTMYYMCAGQAPYSGTTAFELMTKHIKEPLVPLERHVDSVPPAFKSIIEKMLHKEPEQRYPNMGEAAKDIESYLGIDGEGGVFRPRERHLKTLEECAKQYYSAPALTHRWLAWLIFFVFIPMMLLMAVTLKSFAFIGAVIGFTVLTPLLGFLVDGYLNKNSLYLRAKNAALGMPLKNWALVAFGAALGVLILWVAGWIFWWVGVAVLSAGFVMGYQLLIKRTLKSQRERSLNPVHEVLKELRLKGVQEEELERFMARFTGADWEEFYEEFFGYDSMIEARAAGAPSDKVKRRKKYATWRDPIARWLDGIEKSRREAKDRKTLQNAEQEKLVEEGVSEQDARSRALKEVDEIFETGLLPSTVAEREALLKKHRSPLRIPILPILAVVRFVVGLIMTVGSAAMMLGNLMPKASEKIFFSYYSLSAYSDNAAYTQSPIVGLIGLALLMLAFSRRAILPNVALFVSTALIFSAPLVAFAQQPNLNGTNLMIVALGTSGLALAWATLGKITGSRF